jgi:hypothetical protein
MRAVVCVPFRGGDPLRDAAWGIVRAHYQASGLPVVVGDSEPGQPFSRAAARNRAAESAGDDWDVAAFIDADTLIDHRALLRGILTADARGQLILPFTRYWHGSPDGRLPAAPELHQAGGVVCIPRRVWDIVGGYDERFSRWGAEDSAILWAAGTLARTESEPGADVLDGDVYHLWHPRPVADVVGFADAARVVPDAPAGFAGRARPFPELGFRYAAALGDPVAMRAILAER